ncbi:MAG: YitT family protein [Oscillospiraceae bacterium]|nr:YitT family protein [Oscillospiraceae bacterium]MBR0452247.1 YitT family protein [Oscillospiraceae bacterium]
MKKDKLKYWFMVESAVVLLTIGVYFFKTPNNFATGGVSGLSLLLSKVFPVLTQAEYMAAINVLLLVVGVMILGKECSGMTIFCSLQFSALNWLLEKLIPMDRPFTDEPLLELVYAMFLSGIASAMLFDCNASSGGTDIIALILKKYSTMNIGRALMITDMIIVLSNFFINGIPAGLYSLLGLFMKTFLIDNIIESLNMCKAFTIVTTRPDEISRYIMDELHHGVTMYEAEGGYTHGAKSMLLTVCRRADAFKLRKYAKQVDPDSFMIVTNSSEIIGRGFIEE